MLYVLQFRLLIFIIHTLSIRHFTTVITNINFLFSSSYQLKITHQTTLKTNVTFYLYTTKLLNINLFLFQRIQFNRYIKHYACTIAGAYVNTIIL